MRNKKINIKVLSILFIFFCSNIIVQAQAANINVSTAIIPLDATNFVVTATSDGSGDCMVLWDNSTTINADTSRISTGATIEDVNIQPGGTGPGNAESFTFSGLAIDVTHDFTHLTFAGSLQSVGLPSIPCTPTSALPPPVMDEEQPPSSITGTINEVTWSLDGSLDPVDYVCNVQASTSNLTLTPTIFDFESDWFPCTNFETAPGSGVFAHTFNGLSYATYFYHAQIGETPAPPAVKSPFSNVVWQTQAAPSGGGGGGTITPVCGNNIKQYGEQCDDGNIIAGDGCSPTCQLEPTPVCGNNSVEAGETCDDGNTTSSDGCDSACQLEATSEECGNGILETPETCDDGNVLPGDGCSATCDIEHEAPEEQECGNGAVETGEQCDDGNVTSGDGCNAICQIEEEEFPECGDGELNQPVEQCDDGNVLPGDGCSEICELEAVEVRFEIKGAPEFRVPHTSDPNLSLNSQFLVHKPSIANTDTVQLKLDEFGDAVYEGEIVTGTYEFGLNGEAHNTKLIRNIEITPTTEVVVLDFTYADTVKLIAGDAVDTNYINGVDMSKVVQQYRLQGAETLSDFNKDGYVNGIDASIVITNYRKAGEAF